MYIYNIQSNGYYGGATEVPDGTEGIPPGNTRTAPPPIPTGEYAIWQGTYWGLTTTPPPAPPPPPSLQEQNKAEAQARLEATDWVDLLPVSNPENNPHLVNTAEFNAYRLTLRDIAVYPPATYIEFPTRPAEVWSS